jgi:uncharacterized membrane protein
MMTRYIAAYAATLVVMVAVDLVWLGVLARPLYQRGIGHLMAEQADLSFAAVFYLMYVFGLVYLAIRPNASARGSRPAFFAGAALGLFAYATYDLTNLAVLRGWPVWLAAIDVAWGTLISGLSTAAGKAAFDGWGNR